MGSGWSQHEGLAPTACPVARPAIMTKQALRQGSVEVEVELKLDGDPRRRLSGFAGRTPSGGQLVFTIPQDSVLALLRGHPRATIDYAQINAASAPAIDAGAMFWFMWNKLVGSYFALSATRRASFSPYAALSPSAPSSPPR